MTANRALYEPMARAAATAHGVPPAMFAAQIATESNFDPDARNPSGAAGIAQIEPAAHPTVDPYDPPAALDYAAAWMAALHQQFGSWRLALAAYNAGPGNVQQYGGVPPFPETQRYLTAILGDGWPEPAQEAPLMVFNPNTAPERQQQPWACSIRTATWMLRSLGVDIDAGRLQAVLVPDYVTPELGLLQGDGSGLAAVLADQSGCTTGHAWVSWDWLQAHAGTMPIGIGSPSLYHWLAVRDVNPDGTLALANPAPGYRGLYDTMTEAQFDQWAPWAGVWIEVPAENGGDDLSAEERAELESLRSLKTYTDALVGDGGVLPSALGTLEAAADGKSSRAELANVVRGQVAALREATGL